MTLISSETRTRQPVEKRLFHISLILTTGLMGIYAIYGFIIGYEWPVQAVYLSGFAIYAGLLGLFWKGYSFRVLSLTYYYLIIGLVIAAWLPSGGLQGAIIRFVVLIFMSGLMVLDLRDFLGFCAVLLLVVGGFSYLEFSGTLTGAPYTDRHMLLQDLMITNVTMLVVIGIALYFFKKAYLLDRKDLQQINAELEAEKIRAQAADKAKTEFLATISHEMRTPLNGIVGITDLMKETRLDANQELLISKLGYSSDILNTLISDVLDLSLIESGKLVFKEESFHLQDELEEVINLVSPRLQQKPGNLVLRLQMNVRISEKLIAPIKRIRQVLINLLINAIKYTQEGSITLRVDKEYDCEGGVILKFSVEDTGVGIPRERQHNLFTKFYKAHENATVEGTGLGLSISRSLVERMGGTIDYKSDVGIGSVFYFSIPFKTDLTKEMVQTAQSELPSRNYAQISVLVAEDQEINVMVIQRMLENLGISDIDFARDGEEVLIKAQERAFDVILMDVQMPNKDGIEAARELSEMMEKLPVIIALTANVLKEDVEACLEVGMRDFISKPFKKEQLAAVFDKHLG